MNYNEFGSGFSEALQALGFDGDVYDAATGNLSTVTAPSGEVLTYTYDGSLVTSETMSGLINGSVALAYDNDFRVTSQTINGANAAGYTYDADGLLTGAGVLSMTRDAGNGLLTGTSLSNIGTTLTYNSFGEVTDYSATDGANGLFAVTYTRDKLGRITTLIETIGGTTETYAYTYDTAGRLVDVTRNGASVGAYTFDQNGNRLTYTGQRGTFSGTYDAQDRLIAYGSATYTYTDNGELLTKTDNVGTTTYTYDVLGNLTSVTLPAGMVIDYVVDGRNRRVGKKVNGVLTQGFIYGDQLNPVAELDGAGNIVSRFVYGTRANVPDYMVKGGVTYRVISDHLGSPRLVVDATTGAIVQRMDYDEFGNVLNDTNPGFQPFGFAGGIYDQDTGLVRFGARDYDPNTGRWTAKDPILFAGGDTNLYGYVLQDPVNFVDPAGLFKEFIFIQIVKATAKSISNFVLNEIDPVGRRIITAGIGGAAGGAVTGAIVGLPALGVGAVPSALVGATIGFSGGLLYQTAIESFGLGQKIEDLTNEIFKNIKESLENTYRNQKYGTYEQCNVGRQ
jgi:RHS repeat-associated protein